MNNFCSKDWVIDLFKKVIETNLTASDGQQFKFATKDGAYGYITVSDGEETFHKF